MHEPASGDEIEQAVETALRRVLADKELRAQFWKDGYIEFVSHAGNNASQWFGKRILTAIIAAIVTTGLIWLVKIGGIK